MEPTPAAILDVLQTVHPFDSLPVEDRAAVAAAFMVKSFPAATDICTKGQPLAGLHVIVSGAVELLDDAQQPLLILGPGSTFGERALMRDGKALATVRATADLCVSLLPAAEFHRLIKTSPLFARFFAPSQPIVAHGGDLATRKVSDLMARAPITCTPETRIIDAARLMRTHHISSLCVGLDGAIVGILTTRDLMSRVLAEAADPAGIVSDVMTRDPLCLGPDALGSDVLHMMLERGIGHLPIVAAGKLLGIVTQTDLMRFQAVSSGQLVRGVAQATTPAQMGQATARIPQLLGQLVGGHAAHEVSTRLITDIADAATRRLLALAEARLGPAPVPYLWLACGSQGRQEQTGVSDQDNCLFIDDAATKDDMAYFARLARIVSDGLNEIGYFYCPGDMMATNPRWCQRVGIWRQYFAGWIATPDPMAQMLASVMFDLRPIGGTVRLFHDLQAETLHLAARNSIFVAHMISNALKHAPPLGLFRGFATIRSAEHRNQIDMKHNGVAPVVDLGRIYALRGGLEAANTRARLHAAVAAGVISGSGGRDLIEAYDVIAQARLTHQAALVRLGRAPDNFLPPSDLSDFERAHLRDAFRVVRTMQSALSHGHSVG